MTDPLAFAAAIQTARAVQAELAEFRTPQAPDVETSARHIGEDYPLVSKDSLLEAFDSRITDGDLRAATRSRFVSTHYSDAVEAGVKALNECIRRRTGRTEDGDGLMTIVFSPGNPMLRLNRLKSKADESEQRGHMMLCQGVVAAWRNPRAHNNLNDEPGRALMMLETINELIVVTKAAVRARRRRTP